MQLNGYDFKELSQVEGVDVWKAVDKASGQVVQIHLFPAAKQSAANDICQRLILLPADARAKVRQFGAVGDVPCFITDVLPGGESLQNWIGRQGTPAAAPASTQPAPVETMKVNFRKVDMGPAAYTSYPHGAGAAPPPAGGGKTEFPGGKTPNDSRPAQASPPSESFTAMYSDQDLQETIRKSQARPTVTTTPTPSNGDSFSGFYSEDRSRGVDSPAPEREPPAPEPVTEPGSGSLTDFLDLEKLRRQTEPRMVREEPVPTYIPASQPLPPPPPRPSPVSELPPVPLPGPTPFLPPPMPSQAPPPYDSGRVRPIQPGPARQPAPQVSYGTAPTAGRGAPFIQWNTVMWVVLGIVVILGVVIAIVETTG